MKMKNVFIGSIAVCFTFVIIGCGTSAVLSDAGRQVKTIKSDPANDCEEIGTVKGEARYGNHDAAKIIMRNNAATKGANLVRFETYTEKAGNVLYTGTAYKCP